jgi:hypothetical protein
MTNKASFLILAAATLCRLLSAQTSPAADAPVVITLGGENSASDALAVALRVRSFLSLDILRA